MHADSSLIGVGLYTVADVARLTKVHPARIRRWIRGYAYRTAEGVRWQQPVWRAEVPQIGDIPALSFNDLLEIRFVDAFRQAGVSLHKIRRAVLELRELVGTSHPFSQRKVLTDGRSLFMELKDESGEPLLYELTGSRNYAFYEAVFPMLTRGLVFDRSGRAIKWFPDQERNRSVVVDPAVGFGHPVIEGTRINITVLADAYAAEGSASRVAEWYEIDPEFVLQAVDFSERFLA